MKEKRNTLQKRIVTDVFSEMTNHPSAGMVYEAVAEKVLRFLLIFKQKVFCFRRTSARRSKVRLSPQFAKSASEFKDKLRFRFL